VWARADLQATNLSEYLAITISTRCPLFLITRVSGTLLGVSPLQRALCGYVCERRGVPHFSRTNSLVVQEMAPAQEAMAATKLKNHQIYSNSPLIICLFSARVSLSSPLPQRR
jgi:hypothetical protein